MDYKQLESWLHNKLKPLCVADPVPLSQYVIALIKKDKPEKELKDICIDQLEVFLQENTASFVEDLFNTLKSRYSLEKTGSTSEVPDHVMSKNKIIPSERDGLSISSSDALKDVKKHASPVPDSINSTDCKLRRKKSVGGKQKPSSRSRSRSPRISGSSSRASHRSREFELRPEDNDRHKSRYDGHFFDSSPKASNHRTRQDEDRMDGNAFSRRSKQRDIDRQRTARERERLTSRSGFSRSEQDYRDGRGHRRRCRNFDERGFCIFGAQCPFYHGPDALVLPSAEAAADAITQLSEPVTRANSGSLSLSNSSVILTSASSQSDTLQVESVVTTPVPVTHTASVLSQIPLVNNSNSESEPASSIVPVYRPTPINQPISPIVPPTPTATNLSAPVLNSSNFLSNCGWPNFYGPSNVFQSPLLPAPYRAPSVIRHNVVPIPMAGILMNPAVDEVATSTGNAPPAYEPDKPQISMVSNSDLTPSKSIDSSYTAGVSDSNLIYTPSPIKADVTANAYASSSVASNQNTSRLSESTLYVTRLPWRLNDRDKLQEHFSQFGNILRIVTQFNGMPDAALVEFSSPAEAQMTYRNPEPIFSNRFIRLSLWPPHKAGFNQRDSKKPSYPLRHKVLQGRLGHRGQVDSRTDHSWLSSASQVDPAAGMMLLKTEVNRKGGRSRWRLERTTDRVEEELLSGEEEEDDGSNECRGIFNNDRRLAEVTADSQLGYGEEMTDGMVTRDSHPKFEYKRVRTESQSRANVGNKSQTSTYMWQRRKAAALKHRQEQLNFLDKSREARRTVIQVQKQHMTRLTDQLKRIMLQLDGKPVSSSGFPDTAYVSPPLSGSERSTLLSEAKRLQAEIEAVWAAEKKILGTKSLDQEATSVDLSHFGNTSISAAALQTLPEPLAAERRKQMAEVKDQLNEVEADLELLKSKGESLTEARRRIIDLKRKLVNLETVRPSDLALAANLVTASEPRDILHSVFPSRTQTKLDKRPRTLFITKLPAEDVDAFQRALALNYLHTQNVVKHSDPPSGQLVLEITFCTRDFAEAAMRQFSQFHGNLLQMSFAPPPTTESNGTAVEGPIVVSSTQAKTPVSSAQQSDSKISAVTPHSSPTSTTAGDALPYDA